MESENYYGWNDPVYRDTNMNSVDNEIVTGFNEFTYPQEHKELCNIHPIIPARKIEKSWWKIKKTHFDIFFSNKYKEQKPTIKHCPGIYDFTNYGYIVPAWQDFKFKVDENGDIQYQLNPSMENVENIFTHSQEQVDSCPILDNALHILKVVSPWLVSTPKGTSLIICKPFYHYSNDFDICPGVLDSDMDFSLANHQINAMIRFNVKNKVIHIKEGQPLVQIIPFNRTNWKLKYLEIDKYIEEFPDHLKNTKQRRSATQFRHDNSNKKFE